MLRPVPRLNKVVTFDMGRRRSKAGGVSLFGSVFRKLGQTRNSAGSQWLWPRCRRSLLANNGVTSYPDDLRLKINIVFS